MNAIDLISNEYHFVIWQRLYVLLLLISMGLVLGFSKNLKTKARCVNATFWSSLVCLGVAYAMLFERRGFVEPLAAVLLSVLAFSLSKKVDSFAGVFRSPLKNWVFWCHLIGFLVVTNRVVFLE